MTTVRRIYLYLANFISMLLTVIGAILLIAQVVDNGSDAFRSYNVSASSIAIALLVVGAIGWRFYWRVVQREANGSIADRSAGSRKAFLFLTMTISLWLAFILVQQLLADFLVRLFDIGLNNYKPWTLLFSILILPMVWRWHDQVELNDRAANADGTRGSDLRRGYWFVLASFGVFGVISGATTFLAGLFSHLGGRSPSPLSSNPLAYLFGLGSLDFGFFSQSSWQETLLPPLAGSLVAMVAVRFFWLNSQKAATAGDEGERSSKLRSLLIHVVIFSVAISVIGGLVSLVSAVLNQVLVFQSSELIILVIGTPLASIIVGGLVSWYFFKIVRPTLTSPRLSGYIVAGVADLIGLVALVGLISMIIIALAGEDLQIKSIIANILPALLIGSVVWWWFWRRLQNEALQPENTEARTYLWRKVYQYLFQFIGLILVLIGSIIILQQVLSQVMGPPGSIFSFTRTNLLRELSAPIALLLVGGGTLLYMLRTVSIDAKLSNMTIEEMMRHTLGDSLPTWVAILPLLLLVLVVVPIYFIGFLAVMGPAIGNVFSNISTNV
ncbi:MAG TPA: DUF5671 domain-containing protein [Anaerolineae bacterium]|nr:DUF5671 domain-containing protein [Anaerolineae bacterium]